jgi:hypothetical protein
MKSMSCFKKSMNQLEENASFPVMGSIFALSTASCSPVLKSVRKPTRP